jgi:hypothetical protein
MGPQLTPGPVEGIFPAAVEVARGRRAVMDASKPVLYAQMVGHLLSADT